MKIEVSRKMLKLLQNGRALRAEYGQRRAQNIEARLQRMNDAETLADVATVSSFQFHELEGDRKGQFSISVLNNYKMVFVCNESPIPRTSDESLDLKRIKTVRIIELCVDYH